jgi:hypothetical protein
MNIFYDFFFNWETQKKPCFGPIESLLSFSTAQSEKNLWEKIVKQIGENI